MFGFSNSNIDFIQPSLKSSFSSTSHVFGMNPQRSSFQSLSLLDTAYQNDVFQFLPKLFTISTNNGSSQFNTEMLKNVSQVISNEIENNPKTIKYHLDISDDRNVLQKFSRLFIGEKLEFDKEELPILHKITRSLIIHNCPQFMKPENRQLHTFTFGHGFTRKDAPNEAIINQSNFNRFLINTYKDEFIISTHKREYTCRLYAVYSSLTIRNLLLSDPKIRRFEYDFDDEFDEFELICKLLNFTQINITRDNMDSLKKITEDLHIDCILEKINNFIENYDKVNDIFNDQQKTIDLIDDIFSNLHRIKEISVETVKNYILKSNFVKTEDEVRELAAIFIQVIKTDPFLHHELYELLIQLDKESKKFIHLKILLPLIIDQLMFLLGINQETCSFTYILYKNGIISKENLLNCIKKRFERYYQGYQSDFILLTFGDNLDNIIHKNIKEWFLPEMDTINKNPVHFEKERIETCKIKREQNNDDLINSLKNDDVDKLQSILSNIARDSTKILIKDNIFEDIIVNGKPSYINYSAGLGSIKCFKYLLLNHHNVDVDTLKFAVFGGNIEIIKTVDQRLSNDYINNKNQIDLINIITMSIIKHRNDIFDWLLEQKLPKDNNNDDIFNSLIITAAKYGNLHVIIELIDKGFNISSRFTQIIEFSTTNGFYKFAQVLCNIYKDEKEKLTLRFIQKQFINESNDSDYNEYDNNDNDDDDDEKYEESFIIDDELPNFDEDGYETRIILSVLYGNLSIFKLFNYKNERNSQERYYFAFLFCVSKNYFSIIEYYFDSLMKIGFSFNDKQLFDFMTISIKSDNDDIFNYFLKKLEKNSSFLRSIDILIDVASEYNKFEIVKKLFDLNNQQANPIKDFTSAFAQTIKNNSIEICQFLLDNKAVIDFDDSIIQKCDFSSTDEKMLSLLNQYYPEEIKQLFFSQNKLSQAIKNSNVFLIKYLFNLEVPSDDALIQAVLTNKIEIVDLILQYKNSPDFINQRSVNGTALCIAVKKSNKAIVDRLISLPGINPNLYDSNYETPITLAIKTSNIDIINTLLDFYGDNIKSQIIRVNEAFQAFINKFNSIDMLPFLKRLLKIECIDFNCRVDDKSIFSCALLFDSIEIVDILLNSNKFDVNSYSPSNGNTPLIESINSSNFEITKKLIEYQQTDINISNYLGQTPLTAAVSKDDSKVVDLLINNEKFDPQKNRINYSFYISSSTIAKQLITVKSLNVDYIEYSADSIINTPLKSAMNNFDNEKINVILDFYGNDIKSHSKQLTQLIEFFIMNYSNQPIGRRTPSFDMNYNKMIPILKRIIESDVICSSNIFNQLFSFALKLKNLDLMEIILNTNEFDINSNDNFKTNNVNSTPLMVAVNFYTRNDKDIIFLSKVINLFIENKKFDFEKNNLPSIFHAIPIEITKKLVLSKKIDIKYFFNNHFDTIKKLLFDNDENDGIKINQEMFNLIVNHPSLDKKILFNSLTESMKIPGIDGFKQFLAIFDNDINTTNNMNQSLLEFAISFKNKDVFSFILNNDKFDYTNKNILYALAESFKFPDVQQVLFDFIKEHEKEIDFNISITKFIHQYYLDVLIPAKQLMGTDPMNNNRMNGNQLNTNQFQPNPMNNNRMNGNQLNTNQFQINPMNNNRMNGNQFHTNPMNNNRMNGNQLNTNQFQTNPMNNNRMIGNQLNTNQFQINQINNNQMNGNQLNTNQFQINQMNNNQMIGNQLNTNQANTNPSNTNIDPAIEKQSKFLYDVLSYLFNKGVDPNKPDEYNKIYPLEEAISDSMDNIVLFLINTNKIDYTIKIKPRFVFNFKSDQKVEPYKTYLHLAANKPTILSIFLKQKLIDINVTDSNGDTPLMIACKNKNINCVKIFFEYEDLDYLHKNNGGQDALMIISNNANINRTSIKNKEDYLNKIIEINEQNNQSKKFGGLTGFHFGNQPRNFTTMRAGNLNNT